MKTAAANKPPHAPSSASQPHPINNHAPPTYRPSNPLACSHSPRHTQQNVALKQASLSAGPTSSAPLPHAHLSQPTASAASAHSPVSLPNSQSQPLPQPKERPQPFELCAPTNRLPPPSAPETARAPSCTPAQPAPDSQHAGHDSAPLQHPPRAPCAPQLPTHSTTPSLAQPQPQPQHTQTTARAPPSAPQPFLSGTPSSSNGTDAMEPNACAPTSHHPQQPPSSGRPAPNVHAAVQGLLGSSSDSSSPTAMQQGLGIYSSPTGAATHSPFSLVAGRSSTKGEPAHPTRRKVGCWLQTGGSA